MNNLNDGSSTPPIGNEVEFKFSIDNKRSELVSVTASVCGRVIHADKFNFELARQRSKFVKALIKQLDSRFGTTSSQTEIERQLLDAFQHRTSDVEQTDGTPDNLRNESFSTIDVPGPDFGVYRADGEMTRLTNFIPIIERQVRAHDADECSRRLDGRINIGEREYPWTIDAQSFASDQALRASLYETAGVEIMIKCRMDELRNAIAALSDSQSIETTSDFGWNEARTEFRVPGATISSNGWQETGDGDLTGDLQGTDIAAQLRLEQPDESVVRLLKTEFIPALLGVAPRSVVLPLLGMLWVPILAPFLTDARPFCFWLVGNSGVGKSFVARMFQRFYGDFRNFLSWTSTTNSLQMAGFYFQNAIAVIDDYKPEITNQRGVVQLIQNYADKSARGRLKKDATANWSRPFRGWIISTGEDIPEHTPSMLARCVLVRVPRYEKDLDRAQVCQSYASSLPQLTAAFIAWLLQENRMTEFQPAVECAARRIHLELSNLENGARIARNFALLESAFEVSVRFLIDDLVERDNMIHEMRQLIQGMITDIVHEMTASIP